MRKFLTISVLFILILSCAIDSNDNSASRSDESIQLVFQRNKAKLTSVHKKYLNLSGMVTFKIDLDTRGNVINIIIKDTEIKSDKFLDELTQAIEEINFYEGVKYSFIYPLVLISE